MNSRKGEDGLSENTYTAKQEKDVLAALGRGLHDEFPNPERVGCPGREIVAAIAAHRMPLAQAEPYLDHLTSCSPCYRDFLQLQAEHRRARTRMVFAVAASVLIVAALASWAILRPHGQEVVQTVIDLRDRSVPRGIEPPPTEQPVDLPQKTSRLEIYLPLGSSEGQYEVRILSKDGSPIFTSSGLAEINPKGTTVLSVDSNLRRAGNGLYVLQLRAVGSEWNSFALRIQ